MAAGLIAEVDPEGSIERLERSLAAPRSG